MTRNRKVAAVFAAEKPQAIQGFKSSLREWQARYKAQRNTQSAEQEKRTAQSVSA